MTYKPKYPARVVVDAIAAAAAREEEARARTQVDIARRAAMKAAPFSFHRDARGPRKVDANGNRKLGAAIGEAPELNPAWGLRPRLRELYALMRERSFPSSKALAAAMYKGRSDTAALKQLSAVLTDLRKTMRAYGVCIPRAKRGGGIARAYLAEIL